MRKNSMTTKQKLFFSMLSPKTTFRIMCVKDNATLMMTQSKTSRIFFKVTLIPTLSRKMIDLTIVETTEASLLVVTAFCSLIVMTLLPHQKKGLRLLTARLINHKTALAPPHVMTPVRPTFVTNVVFVKIAMLNGLIARCTILPLDRKPQRTFMPCANQLTSQNLNHPLDILPCHHVASVNTTRCIMPMTVIVPDVAARVAALAAALAVALHVVHTVMIAQ